jgi:hypothetical protein
MKKKEEILFELPDGMGAAVGKEFTADNRILYRVKRGDTITLERPKHILRGSRPTLIKRGLTRTVQINLGKKVDEVEEKL